MGDFPQISGRALVVEDDALRTMDMADMLTDIDIAEVRTCASTADAMSGLAALRPTILTLDVDLTDRQDGWALAELAQHTSATPPVIIFATVSPESVPPRIARMGQVIGKPITPAATG